jgi:hypothetical protein
MVRNNTPEQHITSCTSREDQAACIEADFPASSSIKVLYILLFWLAHGVMSVKNRAILYLRNNHTRVRNQKDLFMTMMKDEKAGVTFVLDSELKCSQ